MRRNANEKQDLKQEGIKMNEDERAEIRRLRSLHVVVNDVARQTGASWFEIYEVTEGRDVAVRKISRMHLRRGTGWPWHVQEHDSERPAEPSGNAYQDAALGILDVLRKDEGLKAALDAVPFERRAALLELMTEVARQAMESGAE